MGKRDEVYGNIGRETFEKICKEEEQKPIKKPRVNNPFLDDPSWGWVGTNRESDPEPPLNPLDFILECPNEKCRCNSRKKENEGLNDE